MKSINLPLDTNIIKGIKAGEQILLSGSIITGRDAAHKRLFELLKEGKPLPFDIKGETIYYVGPCPAKPGKPIGPCGPTTSGRVDVYTPALLDMGLKGMIGKGQRTTEVVKSMVKNGAVYFAAIGGAGALYAACVKKAEIICFPEFLSEAVYKLEIKDFPVIAAIDCYGNNIYG